MEEGNVCRDEKDADENKESDGEERLDKADKTTRRIVGEDEDRDNDGTYTDEKKDEHCEEGTANTRRMRRLKILRMKMTRI